MTFCSQCWHTTEGAVGKLLNEMEFTDDQFCPYCYNRVAKWVHEFNTQLEQHD